MPLAIIGRQILRYPSLDSTNAEAKRLIKAGSGSEGLVIIAREQSAGRGKPGSYWFSPSGGLYLSAIVKPFVDPRELASITQLGARAVVKAVAAVTGLLAEIKLPNDVFIDGKKVCGILVERVGSGEVVIGIGVNIKTDFSAELKEKAAALNCDLAGFETALLSQLNDEYLAYLAKI